MGLTGGDFWARINGCDNLYREDVSGRQAGGDIVGCGEHGSGQIRAASFVRHKKGGYYIYILRSCSRCGDELLTEGPFSVVHIDSAGNIISADSDRVANISARQVGEGVVRLVWYYSPLGSGDTPVSFRIHSWVQGQRGGYDEPVCEAAYRGRGVYSCQLELAGGAGYILAAEGISKSGQRCCIGFTGIDVSDEPQTLSPGVKATQR
jgi:hypothetical protein